MMVSDANRRLYSLAALSFVMPQIVIQVGDRAFDIAGPQVINTLPTSMHLTEEFGYAKWLLKPRLFD